MKISRVDSDDHAVVQVEGSLSVENLSQFEEELQGALKKGLHILIDLENLVFIDSSSLGVIVVFYTKLQAQKKHLILLNVSREINEMFSITGLSKRVKMSSSLDAALEHIRSNEL